jgi:hypothetical protein
VSKEVLKLPPVVYLRYLGEKVFRGAMEEPTHTVDDATTAATVLATAGAIGIVSAGAPTGGNNVLTGQ